MSSKIEVVVIAVSSGERRSFFLGTRAREHSIPFLWIVENQPATVAHGPGSEASCLTRKIPRCVSRSVGDVLATELFVHLPFFFLFFSISTGNMNRSSLSVRAKFSRSRCIKSGHVSVAMAQPVIRGAQIAKEMLKKKRTDDPASLTLLSTGCWCKSVAASHTATALPGSRSTSTSKPSNHHAFGER